MKQDEDFELFGDQAAMKSQNFEFRVAKCNQEKRTTNGGSACN
jgi:hypothetical protein